MIALIVIGFVIGLTADYGMRRLEVGMLTRCLVCLAVGILFGSVFGRFFI